MKLLTKTKFFNYYLPLFLSAVLVVASFVVYQIFSNAPTTYASIAFVTDNTPSSTGTVTVAAPANGHVEILCGYNRSAGNVITGISQTGVTWTSIGSESNGSPQLELWWGNVGAGAGTTVTVTWSSGSNILETVTEFSGVDTTAPVDGIIATSSAVSTTATTGSYTNSNANDLMFSCVGSLANATLTSQDGSWNNLNGLSTGSGATNRSVQPEYKIVSSSAAQSESWTVPSNNWSTVMVGLKAAVTRNFPATGINARGNVNVRGGVNFR